MRMFVPSMWVMNRSASGLLVEQPQHLVLLEYENHAQRQRGGITHAKRLAGQAPFAEELARSEHRDDRFFARRATARTASRRPPGCT